MRLADLIRGKPSGPAAAPAPRAASERSAAEAGLRQAEAFPAVGGPSRELVDRGHAQVDRAVAAVRRGDTPDLAPLVELAGALVAALEVDDALLSHALDPRQTGSDLPRHMLNVAIFAVKIGMSAGFPREKLEAAALAGLAHDVGIAALSPDILDKAGALSPEEQQQLLQHPEVGARILRAAGPAHPWLATVVAQEHEREDGSGYPKGLRGEDIHELAKVVGISDVYEAITHPRPYRRRMSPLDAVKEIITAERRAFAEWVLKGLIRGLSTFPVGSLVRLNSREIGRVRATNPAFPLRPVVEVLAGPSGEPLPAPRLVDLAQNSLLYIVDSHSAEA